MFQAKAEKGAVSPQLLRDLITGRLAKEAWGRYVANPLIERVLRIGDKYRAAREADPDVAEGLHLLDNAPQYLRAKAAQQIHDVTGGLSRAQERLFVLMADAESRENLRVNHPQEYRQAVSDSAVQEALRKYRPLEQQLTAGWERLGGAILDRDYLRRVYDEHVSGIGRETAPSSSERATTAFDRVIRPQRTDKFTREASAEYHYQHGLHEFGPAYATKFIGTNLKLLRDNVARDFMSKATQLRIGDPEPRSIEYNGETYYRPDIAQQMRAGQRDVKAYDRYDPTAGQKFVLGEGKFLGPRDVVKVLNDYGRREEDAPGSLRRFFQEQVIGFGFGIPHVFNVLRRVTQSAPLGALNPQGWVRAWRVAFDKELRARGIAGLNDPTFDMLARHGAISTGEWARLKEYWGGNLNPTNWLRTLAQIGHRVIFEPGTAGGLGGFDQRARLYVADLIRSQRPDLTDELIASAVRTQLGDYQRSNWSTEQKLAAKFMLFPGWDTSSIRWVLQHPIKTTVPPALLVLLANQALHQLGKNRPEDQYDIFNIHMGDRSFGATLIRESFARTLFRPALAYAQAKIRGESDQRAFEEASRGLTAGAGGIMGMLRPDLSGFVALATNRRSLFSTTDLVTKEDRTTPGKILPTRALEKQAALVVRHALPALDRMLDSQEELDLRSFAGGNLGFPNYRDDAEKRLLRNAAEADRAYTTISRLAKTNPEQARAFLKDPGNATYALFHRDLAQLVSVLRRMDQAKEALKGSRASAAEKQSGLAAIEAARRRLLENADGLDRVLFQRHQQARRSLGPLDRVPDLLGQQPQGPLRQVPPALLDQRPPQRLGAR